VLDRPDKAESVIYVDLYVTARLTSFKVPDIVEFRDKLLPRNLAGSTGRTLQRLGFGDKVVVRHDAPPSRRDPRRARDQRLPLRAGFSTRRVTPPGRGRHPCAQARRTLPLVLAVRAAGWRPSCLPAHDAPRALARATLHPPSSTPAVRSQPMP